MSLRYLFIFVWFLAACTKEQACVHRLEGEWVLANVTIWANGVEVSDTTTTADSLVYTTTVTFSGYEDDANEGNMSKVNIGRYTDTSKNKTTIITTAIESQKYSVNSNCTQITLEGISDTTTSDNTTLSIIELNKSFLAYEYIVNKDSVLYKYEERLNKK